MCFVLFPQVPCAWTASTHGGGEGWRSGRRAKSRIGDDRTRWSIGSHARSAYYTPVPAASQPRSATTTIRSRIPPAYCYQGNRDARPSHCVWENASPAACRANLGEYMYPPIPTTCIRPSRLHVPAHPVRVAVVRGGARRSWRWILPNLGDQSRCGEHRRGDGA